jgi:hypothetical protein
MAMELYRLTVRGRTWVKDWDVEAVNEEDLRAQAQAILDAPEWRDQEIIHVHYKPLGTRRAQ